MIKEYLLTTKYACAWIQTKNDIIIDTAPIYRKIIGHNINYLWNYVKLEKLKGGN